MNRTVTARNQNESQRTEIEFGFDDNNTYVKGERRARLKINEGNYRVTRIS